MNVLNLTNEEVIALRGEYCAGIATGTPAARSSLYDKIDRLYRDMNTAKGAVIDGEAEEGRAAPGNPTDARPVSADEGRLRRA